MNGRNGSLDGLRGLACLCVMAFHFLSVFYPTATPGFLGEFSVCVFFVLSGYILTADLYVTGDMQSLIRRAAGRFVRLYVPAAVSTVIAFVLLSLVGSDVQGIAPASVGTLLNNLGIDPYIGSPGWWQLLNGSLWTMSIEFKSSLLVFLGVFLYIFWRPSIGLVLAAAIAFSLPGSIWGPYYATFLAGSLIAACRPLLISERFAIPVAIMGCLLGSYGYDPAYARPATDLHCLGAVLLLYGVLTSGWFQSVLARRPLPWLGQISFALYLLHQPILYTVVRAAFHIMEPIVGTGTASMAALPLFVALTFGAAILVERYIDRPTVWLSRAFGRTVSRLSAVAYHHSPVQVRP